MRTAGPGAGREAERSREEFRRARRHSRLVGALKVALPLGAVLIVAGGVAVTWLARSLPDLPLSSVGFEDGRVVMEDPRMSGTDSSDRPYSMVAERAIQSLTGAGGIELEGVKANLGISDSATADILAAKGHYDQTAETLRLFDGIEVTTSDGMTIALKGADIDLAKGSMSGTGPVAIRMPGQTIEAGRLDVADGGKRLGFGGRVKMTILPSAGGRAAAAISEGAP